MSSTAHIPATVDDGMGVAPDGAPSAEATPNAAQFAPELVAKALGPTFRTIFHSIASMRGKHWELEEFEKSALVEGWTPIVQTMLAKLGDSETAMLTLAIGSTLAIVGGKVAQDATKRASSKGSTKTPESVASSASSANVEVVRPQEPSSSSEMLDAA